MQTSFTHEECMGLPPHGISPLFSFGHAILSKNQWAVSEEVLFFKSKPNSYWLSLLQLFYGLNDVCTIIGNIPVVSQKSTTKQKNTGLGDCYLNLYSRLFNNSSEKYDYRIIGVTGLRFPSTTGAFGETIFTLNTTSFFFGITQDALTRDWYLFTDFGALLFLKKGCRHYGHLINFNTGAGRSFCFNENYLTVFIELSDFYSRPDKINKQQLLTTGGNILFIGPTLRYTHKNGFLAQAGIQFNAGEHLRNRLSSTQYIVGGFIAYSF